MGDDFTDTASKRDSLSRNFVESNDAKYFPICSLPSPVLQHLLSFLSYAEVESLRLACRSQYVDSICRSSVSSIHRRIEAHSNCSWYRFLGNKCDSCGSCPAVPMASRCGHSLAYVECLNAVYIFGGKATKVADTDDEENLIACFNDLWKLDLATNHFDRCLVNTSPYPLPKYEASMVAYKDYLVLFGGRLPYNDSEVLRGHHITGEIHIFNCSLRRWKRVTATNNGPKLGGHSATVIKHYMIVFGGYCGDFMMNHAFWVFNIEASSWSCIELQGGIPSQILLTDPNSHRAFINDFPIMNSSSTSLIPLTDESLLLLGERKFDFASVAIVVDFSLENVENGQWNWRVIPISGKCVPRPPANPNQPHSLRSRNSEYPKVVALRTRRMLRLVTVGVPNVPRNAAWASAQVSHMRTRRIHFLERFRSKLIKQVDQAIFLNEPCSSSSSKEIFQDLSESLSGRRSHMELHNSSDGTISVDVVSDGISCFVRGIRLYNPCPPLLRASLSPRKRTSDFDNFTVELSVENSGRVYLDEIDCWQLEEMLRAEIFTQQFRGHTDLPRPVNRCGRSTIPQSGQMVSFTAELWIPEDFRPEDVKEICYVQGDSHPCGPPITNNFALCAAFDKVIMHGGEVQSGVPCKCPGITYYLSSSSHAKCPLTTLKEKLGLKI